ncbi:MAG: hypothetical protein AB8G95_15020 [Anaerolineae bacterium]
MSNLPIITFIKTDREIENILFARVIESIISLDLRILERPENDYEKEVLAGNIKLIRPQGVIWANDKFRPCMDQKLCELLKTAPGLSTSKILLLFDGAPEYDLGPPPKFDADQYLRLPASPEDIRQAVLELLE